MRWDDGRTWTDRFTSTSPPGDLHRPGLRVPAPRTAAKLAEDTTTFTVE